MNWVGVKDILRVGAVAVGGLVVFWAGLWIWGNWYDEWSGYNAQYAVSDGSCNIAVVPVTGDITTFPNQEADPESYSYPVANVDDILQQLRMAEGDPNIAGILVRIDSYGGSPVASEVLADAIKASSLPVAALIREVGTSGGYLVASGADTIFASALSDVGSIGITMSYVDNVGKNAKDGFGYVQLSSAPYKDAGDPNKPLTAADRALFERDLKIYHEEFVRQVAENREMPVEEVAKLADGSSMPGALALEKGLIDALGNQAATRSWFAQELDLLVTDITFCE